MSEQSPETYADGFWEAAERGVLAIQRCDSCGKLQLYPRRHCSKCGSATLGYVDSSGEGSVYTFSTIHRNPPSDFVDDLPYTLGIVELAEGPRLLTQIVGCKPEEISCDMPVRVEFVRRDDRPLPFFAPAEGSE